MVQPHRKERRDNLENQTVTTRRLTTRWLENLHASEVKKPLRTSAPTVRKNTPGNPLTSNALSGKCRPSVEGNEPPDCVTFSDLDQ